MVQTVRHIEMKRYFIIWSWSLLKESFYCLKSLLSFLRSGYLGTKFVCPGFFNHVSQGCSNQSIIFHPIWTIPNVPINVIKLRTVMGLGAEEIPSTWVGEMLFVPSCMILGKYSTLAQQSFWRHCAYLLLMFSALWLSLCGICVSELKLKIKLSINWIIVLITFCWNSAKYSFRILLNMWEVVWTLWHIHILILLTSIYISKCELGLEVGGMFVSSVCGLGTSASKPSITSLTALRSCTSYSGF